MKKTQALLDRAKQIGYLDAALEVADTLKECAELSEWIKTERDKEFSASMQESARRGEFRKLMTRDSVVKFR